MRRRDAIPLTSERSCVPYHAGPRWRQGSISPTSRSASRTLRASSTSRPAWKPAVIAQFSRLMSTQTSDPGQFSAFGTTAPVHLPARGGAASATPCWPASMRYRRERRPKMMPSLAKRPAAAISRRVAKRASPCSARRRWRLSAAMPANTKADASALDRRCRRM